LAGTHANFELADPDADAQPTPEDPVKNPNIAEYIGEVLKTTKPDEICLQDVSKYLTLANEYGFEDATTIGEEGRIRASFVRNLEHIDTIATMERDKLISSEKNKKVFAVTKAKNKKRSKPEPNGAPTFELPPRKTRAAAVKKKIFKQNSDRNGKRAL